MLKCKMGVLLASGLLAACSSTTYQQAADATQARKEQADRLTQVAAQPLPKADTSVVPIHQGVYLGATVLKRQSGQTLPRRVEREGVRLVTAAPQDLLNIGDLIAEATGIPVSFAADVFATQQTTKTETNAVHLPSPMGGGDVSVDKQAELAAALDAALPKAVSASKNGRVPPLYAGKLSEISREKMRVNYTGPLSGFLSLTASYFDIGWSFSDGRLQFSRNVTRSFQLAAMPTTLDSNASMTAGLSGGEGGGGGGGGGGSSGGSGGGSSSGGGSLTAGATQTSKVAVKLDFWKDLQDSLKTIVGTGGTFTASPSSSMVTVTAPASVVERVARHIHDMNKQLLRQVTIKVEVYNVTLDKDSKWQFDLAARFKAAGAEFGLGNSAATPTTPGALTAGILEGPFSGSRAILNLLDAKGDVSVVTTASLTTMSGQPVPVQVSNTQNYLASMTTTVTTGVVVQTANIGSVNSGFSINVLPKVMDDGKILLQYSMNISSLVGKDGGFNDFVFEGNTYRMPNLDQRSFIQSGVINNGATLVLAGYERVSNKTSDTGQGSANFKLLGGTRKGMQAREVMVICITPVVLDHSSELASLN